MNYSENDDERQLLIPCIIPEYDAHSTWDQGTSSMKDAGVGISQQQLVDVGSAKKLPQVTAAVCATLGALATGTVLGWSAPAQTELEKDLISKEQFAWVSSISTLGAALICMPIGVIMNKIGRRMSMLALVVPFVVGWILLLLANNFAMLCAGRFMIGLAGGAFCVTAPTYTSEIAQDDIRGALGSLFQLMVTIGILVSYIIGGLSNLFVLNIVCLIIPIIFGVIFFFMPETPYYLLTKSKYDDATKSLMWLRGASYNPEVELQILNRKIEESRTNPLSFRQSLSRKAAIKTLIICYSVMLFQQFSGINAVLFNASDIFEKAGASLSNAISTIIIGIIQVLATLLSTFVVDRLGRKILLLFSGVMMGLCLIALAVYFHLKDDLKEEVDNISWIPLLALCVFIIAFSLGFGPIPWMIAGDLCTPDIKAFVSSTAGTFNWVLAFIVTRTFSDMQQSIGNSGAFWFFCAFTFASVVFVFLFIPETKGKSNDEIQAILRGDNNSATQEINEKSDKY